MMHQKRRKAQQIWIGTFSSAEQFYGFICEREDFYQKCEHIEDYALSNFIETQGEAWFDHDFCEGTYSDKILKSALNLSISFAGSWGEEINRRMKLVGINTLNACLSLGLFEPNAQERPEVRNPVSVEGEGFIFHYMGVVEFDC